MVYSIELDMVYGKGQEKLNSSFFRNHWCTKNIEISFNKGSFRTEFMFFNLARARIIRGPCACFIFRIKIRGSTIRTH